MGQKQALTNEAIALAQHAQNEEANQHTQNIETKTTNSQQAQTTSRNNKLTNKIK